MKNKIEKGFKILAGDIVYYGYGIERIITIFKNLQQKTAQAIFDDYCKDCYFKSEKYCNKEKCSFFRYMKKWGCK